MTKHTYGGIVQRVYQVDDLLYRIRRSDIRPKRGWYRWELWLDLSPQQGPSMKEAWVDLPDTDDIEVARSRLLGEC